MTVIGVLALQGDFAEHIAMLKRLKVETAEGRLPVHLKGLDGLIIPGGESTTIGKLAVAYDLLEPLREFGQRHVIWGTCAGTIFLSKDVRRDQPLLGMMDFKVERNAFGRQIDSFEDPMPDGDWQRAPDVAFEIRVPWLLLNVSDPSGRHVLLDPPMARGTEAFGVTQVPDVGITLGARRGSRLSTTPADGVARYAWESWDEPRWEARRRPGFEVMRDTWRALELRMEKEVP